MAKKQVPPKRSRNQRSPQTPKTSLTKTRNPTTTDTKNRNKTRTKASEAAIVAPTKSRSKEKDLVVSQEKKKPKIKEEKKKPKSNEKKNPNPQTQMHGGAKKRSKKEPADDGVQSAGEELYAFPMTRVSRIIKSDNPDIRVSQEAVFLINRASEKFLQVFCKEVYASSFLKGGSYAAYNHLSSVVAKRKRFEFLSDFVPEKVKAADALARASEAEK